MAKTTNKPIPKTTTGKGRNYKPTEHGAGMTAKGRAEYNAKNNANLKPPAPNPKTRLMRPVRNHSAPEWGVCRGQ